MIIDPFRLGFTAIHLAVRLIGLPFRILKGVLGSEPVEQPPAPQARPEPEAAEPPPRREAAPARPAPVVAAAPPAPAESSALEPEEPAHIDDEPELVAEFSEEGAEEGAHAELRVDEPWDGYRSMKVPEVRERIASATTAELAVIQLYEQTHRNRRTLLDAIERRNRQLANQANADANARTNGR